MTIQKTLFNFLTPDTEQLFYTRIYFQIDWSIDRFG